MPGVASMSLGSRYWAPSDGLVGLVGQEPADKRREQLDEGQENDGVEDVEQRMGVGDLVGDARRVMAINSW